MKKILFLLLAVVPFFFAGCQKEKESDILKELEYGNVKFYNNSLRSSYRVRLLDSDSKIVNEYVLSSGEYIVSKLEYGVYSWSVYQLNGYVLYPTEQSGVLTLSSFNKYVVINFPN